MPVTVYNNELSNRRFHALRVYNLYRAILGLLFIAAAFSPIGKELITPDTSIHFKVFAFIYLGINMLIIAISRKPPNTIQIFTIVCLDIVLLSLLFYLSRKQATGLGNLLIVSVAAGNILLKGRTGIAIAALATLCIIALSIYQTLVPDQQSKSINAGLLGAIIFATAIFVQSLSERIRRSEELARQRSTEFYNLQKLNQLIIQRMRTGILVIDAHERIIMMNQASHFFLNSPVQTPTLLQVSPDLHACYQQWKESPEQTPKPFQTSPDRPKVQSSFTQIYDNESSKVIIFLDDLTALNQQAQQLKLASLGKLTAAIAHEIRNPLGAISHAAQLLNESDQLNNADQRLIEIIQNHSRRMNIIIENVLQLTRRKTSNPQALLLNDWIKQFLTEEPFPGFSNPVISFLPSPLPIQVMADPDQITQVVTNLCQNGLRYSFKKNQQATLQLHTGLREDNGLPYLDITDNGPGMKPEVRNHLFVPFYTTEPRGTGLGLYISKELCEANQATLELVQYEPGCTFRITFTHGQQESLYLNDTDE
ncbi:sensor histidine kinase [Zooshikella ganghwensis]|uniref:sensor histidine kinase n=1 Tax=Zooshikella ganghwensis TaxID=202772 RepID=UPI000570066C|nr:ATP-binding protein [Zooshikella ganghwensis]